MSSDLALPRCYTPPEVAKFFRCDVRKVLGWIERAELEATNIATSARGQRPRWRVTADALERFMRRRSPAPRPRAQRRGRAETCENFF